MHRVIEKMKHIGLSMVRHLTSGRMFYRYEYGINPYTFEPYIVRKTSYLQSAVRCLG